MNTFTRLKVQGWRQFRSVDISLHPRLTILTGANGAGKSTLLGVFTKHFGYQRNLLATPINRAGIRGWSYSLFEFIKSGIGLKSPQPSHKIGELTYSSGTISNLVIPQNNSLHYQLNVENQQSVLGIHIDSHRPPNIYRHVAHFGSTPPTVEGLGQNLNNEYINYFATGGIQNGSLHHIKATLIEMSIFGNGNGTMEPVPELMSLFSGFEEKLKVVLPSTLGFRKLIIRSPEVLLSTRTGDFLLDASSGGVIKLFEIAWQIYFFSQNKERFVVTIDEPENHLHPSMQKSMLPNLLVAFPNAQFIVATHSPFIISAIRESSVYVLSYEETDVLEFNGEATQPVQGSRVVSQQLDTVNKAGSASEILRDVLGLTSTIPDWAESRVDEIVAEYFDKQVDEETLNQLFEKLQEEGLANSYPHVLQRLTRKK